jgi:hypothetical protein
VAGELADDPALPLSLIFAVLSSLSPLIHRTKPKTKTTATNPNTQFIKLLFDGRLGGFLSFIAMCVLRQVRRATAHLERGSKMRAGHDGRIFGLSLNARSGNFSHHFGTTPLSKALKS